MLSGGAEEMRKAGKGGLGKGGQCGGQERNLLTLLGERQFMGLSSV